MNSNDTSYFLYYLGYTQGDVGSALGRRFPNDFSQTTISRFEASNLSAQNMRKLKPMLQSWLQDTEHRAPSLVSNTFASRLAPDEPVSDGKRRKKRTTIEDSSKGMLEVCFKSNPKPTASDLSKIASEHNIERDVVRVWFCNRRQREKKLSTKYVPIGVIQNNMSYNQQQQQTVVSPQNPDSGTYILPPVSRTETDPNRAKSTRVESASEKAVLSAAMMSPQGATLRGYARPFVFNNG